jgi:hypothetical protein
MKFYPQHETAEHQTIERWAYRNWQECGSPMGSPEVDWFPAEQEYRQRNTSNPPTLPFSSFAMGPAEL